jgi:hypothetical protein
LAAWETRKGLAKVSVLQPQLYYYNRAGAGANDETVREDASSSPGLKNSPPTSHRQREILFLTISLFPVAFKAISCIRRAEVWNRQASIVVDLTTLAIRHGRRCSPRV